MKLFISRTTTLIVLQIVLVFMVLFAVGCAPKTAQFANVTPVAYANTATPVRGIVADFSTSNITLDAGIGRLVLQIDNNTAFVSIAGAASVNDLRPGMEVVAYYTTGNIATQIQILKLPLATLVTGVVTQNIFPNLTLSTATGDLVLNYVGAIVIRKDGSAGSISDIVPGINLQVFYYPKTNTAVAIEIK